MANQPELFFSRDHFGVTPLHRAILQQRYDVVQLIVKSLPIALDACDYVSFNEKKTKI